MMTSKPKKEKLNPPEPQPDFKQELDNLQVFLSALAEDQAYLC